MGSPSIIAVNLLPGLILGIGLLSPLLPVLADDDDYIEARRLQDSGEILPLQSILNNLRQSFPGKILEIDLEKEDGHIAYEIEILGEDGEVREVYINAKTGKLLSIKDDD